MSYSRWCVIYRMCVFNLACAGTCKSDHMPAPFRSVIFNSFNFFEFLRVVLINMVCNFDDFSKIGYSRPS